MAQSRGGACFCTRGAMQDYAVITFSRVGKNRDTGGSPRRCRGGLCRCTPNGPIWLEISRGTEGNCIYRPVRDSSGFNFLYPEQRRTHMSRDKQVPLSTQQAATHPMKRSPGAELGGNRVTNLTGYKCSIFFSINLSGGAVARLFEARGAAGPPYRCDSCT